MSNTNKKVFYIYINETGNKYSCPNCSQNFILENVHIGNEVTCPPCKSVLKFIDPNNPSANPEFKKCPICAETVKYEAKICRFCQNTFEGAFKTEFKTLTFPQRLLQKKFNLYNFYKQREQLFDVTRQSPDYCLGQIWNEWNPIIKKVTTPYLKNGWEVDKENWGPNCIKFSITNVTPLSNSASTIILFLIAILTAGIGLILIILAAAFMTGKRVMYIREIKITLKREMPLN